MYQYQKHKITRPEMKSWLTVLDTVKSWLTVLDTVKSWFTVLDTVKSWFTVLDTVKSWFTVLDTKRAGSQCWAQHSEQLNENSHCYIIVP